MCVPPSQTQRAKASLTLMLLQSSLAAAAAPPIIGTQRFLYRWEVDETYRVAIAERTARPDERTSSMRIPLSLPPAFPSATAFVQTGGR